MGVVRNVVAASLLAVSGGASAQLIWSNAAGSTVIVRNSLGVPVTIGMPTNHAFNGLSGGSATLTANRALTVSGAASQALTLTRSIPTAKLVGLGVRAAKLVGPVGIASLGLAGLTWVVDKWMTEETAGSPLPNRVWWHEHGGTFGCSTQAHACNYVGAQSALTQVMVASMAPGWTVTLSGCSYLSGNVNDPNSLVRYKCVYNQKPPTGPTVPIDRFIDAYGTNPNDLPPQASVPATDQQIADAIQSAITAATADMVRQVTEAAWAHGNPTNADTEPLQVTGPGTIQGPTTTSTVQTGQGTQTTTISTTYNITYNGDTITINKTEITNHPDGSTTTTTSTSPGEVPPSETCGLPSTPPCKIDETGTPTAEGAVSQGQQSLTAALDARQAQLAEKTAQSDLGWLLNLPGLQASCSGVEVGNLWTLNICPALDLSRVAFGFLWGALAMLYCWRRVGETVAQGV